jgi:hypothetical protein
LEKLYGDVEKDLARKSLQSKYAHYSVGARSNRSASDTGFPSPEQCKELFLDLIDKEVDRLQLRGEKQALIDSNRVKLESAPMFQMALKWSSCCDTKHAMIDRLTKPCVSSNAYKGSAWVSPSRKTMMTA